jgi:archaellum component FlaC
MNINRIKVALDSIQEQLEKTKRERDEYKASYRNAVAEIERLKASIEDQTN